MGVLTGDLERDERVVKITRWLSYSLLGLIVAIFITMCIVTGYCNNRYRALAREYNAVIEQRDSIRRECSRLGSLDCITVNMSLTINNKNALGVTINQGTQISRTMAKYTRDEVLTAMDSLYKERSGNGYFQQE